MNVSADECIESTVIISEGNEALHEAKSLFGQIVPCENLDNDCSDCEYMCPKYFSCLYEKE